MNVRIGPLHYREPQSMPPGVWARSIRDSLCGIPSEAFSLGSPTAVFWTYTKERVTCPFCREFLEREASEEAP